MTNISDFNSASNAATDGEHDVQLGLLQALCGAVAAHRDAASVSEILDQLIAYSEAHFMSEELLMRLKSHDDYADHVDDHSHMLDVLRQIAADHAAGSSPLVAAKAAEVLDFIGNHIATRDRRFADQLRNGQ
ncbi:Hemerythrin-like metal-binding protein [Candidatus Accumulibacter aalborgensis]|uniref:Hemerythrin-like metal-binding protein n=1 Tax=Candidatus Accumulibacter aalborgensis TaxID=1860102 RepID=A0A1A8XU15_9PROT|nr:hemerythrin family protein [Candidatus Accumulibacter aalborgensis]SBT08555.1 Hemerythrin-like metal-binding protein [Candidatus Accumulibacter aalborgensis]